MLNTDMIKLAKSKGFVVIIIYIIILSLVTSLLFLNIESDNHQNKMINSFIIKNTIDTKEQIFLNNLRFVTVQCIKNQAKASVTFNSVIYVQNCLDSINSVMNSYNLSKIGPNDFRIQFFLDKDYDSFRAIFLKDINIEFSTNGFKRNITINSGYIIGDKFE